MRGTRSGEHELTYNNASEKVEARPRRVDHVWTRFNLDFQSDFVKHQPNKIVWEGTWTIKFNLEHNG